MILDMTATMTADDVTIAWRVPTAISIAVCDPSLLSMVRDGGGPGQTDAQMLDTHRRLLQALAAHIERIDGLTIRHLGAELAWTDLPEQLRYPVLDRLQGVMPGLVERWLGDLSVTRDDLQG